MFLWEGESKNWWGKVIWINLKKYNQLQKFLLFPIVFPPSSQFFHFLTNYSLFPNSPHSFFLKSPTILLKIFNLFFHIFPNTIFSLIALIFHIIFSKILSFPYNFRHFQISPLISNFPRFPSLYPTKNFPSPTPQIFPHYYTEEGRILVFW